jgi:ABC-type multidrug transport system ATPase subunit
MWAIETRNLRKVYRPLFGGNPITAVDNLNLQVPAGTVFGFLGPNGAGKTTTIQILIGNVYPTAGEAFVLGIGRARWLRNANSGFCPKSSSSTTF